VNGNAVATAPNLAGGYATFQARQIPTIGEPRLYLDEEDEEVEEVPPPPPQPPPPPPPQKFKTKTKALLKALRSAKEEQAQSTPLEVLTEQKADDEVPEEKSESKVDIADNNPGELSSAV